jgi:hypothetical protein
MKKNLCKLILTVVVMTSMTLPGVTFAQDDGWKFEVGLYGWYADINAETPRGSEGELEAEYAIDNFKMAFMGAFEAQKNNWGFLVDVFYVNTEDEDAGPLSRANVELTNWIVTPIATYRFVEKDSFELSALAGARYLYLKPEVTVETQPPLPPRRLNFSESDGNWDGIIGLRGRVKFSNNWYLPFHLDIGTGDSDVTWQTMAGIGYQFSWGDIVAGYRYIDWEFDDRKILAELDVSGLFAGVKFRF